MKSVLCIYNGQTDDLTVGRIYDVIYGNKEAILIRNDKNEQGVYYIKDTDSIWFEDATPYIREEKLNSIL